MSVTLAGKYHYVTKQDYDRIADPSWPSWTVFNQHQYVPDHVYKDIDRMLVKPFDHPSFCILPFHAIEYPSQRFCCLTPMGTDREKVKNKMIAGHRPAECAACWKLEDSGMRSDRMIKNETFDFYHGTSISTLYQRAKNTPDTELTCVKIDSDNTCNSTCVTCNPYSSTAWGSLLDPNKKIITWHTKRLSMDLDLANLKMLMFRGGEPFLSKNNFDILDDLIQHGNDSCVISFVTNGSIWPTPSQLANLMRFKNLVISVSVDGIGPVFEYLRWPLRWDTVSQNLNRWQALGVQVGISYTLSNLNLYYHNETQQWFDSNGLEFMINPVTAPEWFAVNSLPEDFKKSLRHKILDQDVLNLLREHHVEDNSRFELFKKNILFQDRLKNISIRSYLPELANATNL